MPDEHTSDPRIQLVALATAAGLTTEAATIAAQLAKLTAEPTDQDLEAEVQRILSEATPSDFVDGHVAQQGAFLRALKVKILAERQTEGPRTPLLDERLTQGAGSAAAELDKRLGRVAS